MKNLFDIMLCIASLCLIACDSSISNLNWNKTADQQNLKIGDIIIVEGKAYESIGNPLGLEWNSDEKTYYWIKKGWESKTHAEIYNPDEPDDADFDPLAPIGVVICTIYNPSAYEQLSRINDMYPERRKYYKDFPSLIHRIRFTGKIYSFEREYIKGYNDKPDMHLACVRIHVSSLEVIESN